MSPTAGPSRLPRFHVGEPLPHFVHRTGIFESRRVADFLAGDEGPDHAAPDLPAPGLRQLMRDVQDLGGADRPNFSPDVFPQLPPQRIRPDLASPQADLGTYDLAFE